MPRGYNNNILEQINSKQFIAVDLVYLDLQDINHSPDPVYLCTGGFDVVYGGNNYSAQGEFMGFSSVDEDFDVKVGKFQIYLSALNSEYVGKFIYQDPVTGNKIDMEGRKVIIRKAFLDINNNLSVIDAITVFEGIIYNVVINESEVTAQITIECATLFADFERTAGRKTNNGSNWLFQGTNYDTCFAQAGIVGNSEYKWGKL